MTAPEEFQTEHFLHRSMARHPLRWVTGFFLLALIWRGINACYGDTAGDGFGFMMIARSILEDGHLATPYICKDIIYHHDFLYPLFIALGKLVTGDYVSASRAVNVLAGALVIFPVYGLTQDIYGKRPGVYAAALLVINPLLAEYSSNSFSEPLYILFGVTGIWFWWRAWLGNSWRYLAAGAVMMALACFVRSQGLSLVVSALLGIGVAAVFFRKTTVARAVGLLFMMLVLWAAIFFPVNRAMHRQKSGMGEKIHQELFKKKYIFDEKNPDWIRWERKLSSEGRDLIWVKMARDSAHLGKWSFNFYSKIVARDLCYFLVRLLDNRLLPFLLLFPVVVQVLSDTRALNFRRGGAIYLTIIVFGMVFSLALVAVTLYRYLVIAVPLFLVVAGAGMDTIDRFFNYILRRDRVPQAFFNWFPAIIIFASIICYAHPVFHDLSTPEPIDSVNRQVAQWLQSQTDPDRRENIMTFTPGIPFYSGDYFFSLPFDTAARVGAYARAQGADYVLIMQDENWLTTEEMESWQAPDLTAVGLQLVSKTSVMDPKKRASSYVLYKVLDPKPPDESSRRPVTSPHSPSNGSADR